MRKIAAVLILVVSSAVLLLAMNQSFINGIKQDRYFDHLAPPALHHHTFYDRVFVRSDRWRYGDLYGLCYLPQYKFKLEPFRTYPATGKGESSNKILYVIGDSYLADKTLGGAFSGFDDVIYLDDRFPFGPISLESSKTNFLIMEFAERNLVDYDLYKTTEQKWTSADLRAGRNFSGARPAASSDAGLPTTISERLNKILFNRDLSRNLELLLFDDKALSPLKELKAALNYRLFGRLSTEVTVSTDKRRLLMNATVDTAFRQSAFRAIPNEEIDRLRTSLDRASNYYQAIGFKKVFLAVIPNPVSLYDSSRMPYNHLLERVERVNKFPIISVFNTFKNDPRNLYYRSDTHWNPDGFDVWIKKANETLLINSH